MKLNCQREGGAQNFFVAEKLQYYVKKEGCPLRDTHTAQ